MDHYPHLHSKWSNDLHEHLLTTFCLPILASVVAAKAFEEADLMSVSFEKLSPYGGGTPLCSSLHVKPTHVTIMHELPVQHTSHTASANTHTVCATGLFGPL